MESIFLIVINSEGLVTIAECFNYETDQYKVFPNNEGEEIIHSTEQSAIDWIRKYIKPELIDPKYSLQTITDLHRTYLKKSL